MHKTDAPGHVGNLFSDGNPAVGQQATMVDAAWLNGVQESLRYLVEQANLPLIKGDYTKVYAAIVAIATGAAGAGGGSVPTARQILAAGLAAGGGDLTANRTITVPKASAAEVAAGVRDDVAVTPLALLGGQGARLLAGVGYATLFGLILQWGTATLSANSSANVTLPIAFPSQCVWADFAGGRQDFAAQDNNPFVSNWSATAITLFNSADTGVSGRFLALGF
jgi:hypothetical protein